MKCFLRAKFPRHVVVWILIYALAFLLRIGWLIYERSQPPFTRASAPTVTDPDYLVVIPKFGVSDLESARRLIGQTLWVKAGYQATYFQFSPHQFSVASTRHSFEPLETIRVNRVAVEPQGIKREKDVLVFFEKEDKSFASVIGQYLKPENRYTFQLDQLFYPKDPHLLFPHWSQEIWRALENHEVQEKMSFLQVPLSLGIGNLVAIKADGSHLYHFPRRPGGSPGLTAICFVDGKVKDFQLLN